MKISIFRGAKKKNIRSQNSWDNQQKINQKYFSSLYYLHAILVQQPANEWLFNLPNRSLKILVTPTQASWEASMAKQLFQMHCLRDINKVDCYINTCYHIPIIICHLHHMDTNICSITYKNFSPKTALPRFPFPCWVNLKIHVTWGSKYLSMSKSHACNWCRAEEKDNLKAQFHSLVAQIFCYPYKLRQFWRGCFLHRLRMWIQAPAVNNPQAASAMIVEFSMLRLYARYRE